MPTARASSRRGRELARATGFVAALIVVGLTWARGVRAEPMTVVLVHKASSGDVLSETTTRLRAELAAAGFDVDELVAEPGADPEELLAARTTSAPPSATLSVTEHDDTAAVDLSFLDPKTHERQVRHVDMPPVARQRGPSALAVRAVELLRASLLGEAPREAPTPEPPKPPEPRSREPRPGRDDGTPDRGRASARAPWLVGELGAGMLYGARGISPAFAPLLRFQAGTRTWAGRVSLLAPAFGGEVSAAGGSATLREELLSLDATVTLPAKGTLAFVGSAGAGGYHWHVSGEGTTPNVGHDVERWGAVVEAGAGALVRLGARAGLLLDAQALWFAPPLVVRIAGVEAGKSGQPTLCASIGFWVAL